MAGSEILKEGRVVSTIRRTVTKAKNNSDSGKKDIQPKYMEIRGFKIHELCYRCVYVTVCTYTTIQMKMRIKIIVTDVESVVV